MTDEDEFNEIHDLLRSGRLDPAYTRLYDARRKRIKPPYDSDLNHAWYLVADINYSRERFDQAIEALRKALEEWPDDVDALCLLGSAYAELGKTTEAEAQYRQGLTLNPESEWPYLGLGCLYSDRGMHREAEKNFRKALELDPTSDAALYDLANSLFDQGRFEEAIPLYDRVVSGKSKLSKKAERNRKLAKAKMRHKR